jgi:hypothetical protein
MKIRFFLFTALLLIFSCNKNRNHPVPSIPFDISINISLPSYSDLQGVGSWAYVNGGAKGIIVYRKSYDQFVAFDRQSPADGGAECATPLTPDSTNFLQLNDICSGATFSLYDGSPMAGSDYGLRQYQVVWDGNYVVRIYN